MSTETSNEHHHHHSSGSSHHSSGSHHSSSHRHSRSHRRRKRERSSDRKAYRKSRYAFAFLLFLTITVFALSLTARLSLLSAKNVGDIFINHAYVSALSEDVLTYATDLCRDNNVPVSAAEDVVTYSAVNEIDRAYIIGTLSLDEQYTEQTYEGLLEEFNAKLEDSINTTLKENGVKSHSGVENGSEQLAKSITDYLKERMTFPFFDKVETIINLGKTGILATVLVSGILSVALVLIVIALGSKLYRNMRSVCHAFSASAIVCLLVPVVYSCIKTTKAIGFYPTYLNDSIMSYFNSSASSFALAGGLLAALSFALIAVEWKLKSDDLDS